MNGTWVNGERLRERRSLEEGDLIALGQGGPRLKVVRFEKPERVVLGRDASCDIVLSGPQLLAVSRQHSAIFFDREGRCCSWRS